MKGVPSRARRYDALIGVPYVVLVESCRRLSVSTAIWAI